MRKGAIGNLTLFLFMIAAIALLFGKNQPIVSLYNLTGTIEETGSGSTFTSNTDFSKVIATMIVFSSVGGAIAGLIRADIAFGIVAGFTAFLFSVIAGVPIAIFSDPSLPFAVKLIFGMGISIMVLFAIVEFFTGRNT